MANFTLIEAEGLGQIVRKSQVILSSQTWTAPLRLAGNTVYVTGCAGGASGAYTSDTAQSVAFMVGGAGGNFVEKLPLVVTPGAAYMVTIPAGGAASTGPGNNGGDLTFGSLLTITGGRVGTLGTLGNGAANLRDGLSVRGVQPPMCFWATNVQVFNPGQCINGNIPGVTVAGLSGTSMCGGGAAGYFGNGTSGVASAGIATSANAPANSGAGSGAVIAASGGSSGAGGSGRLIIEWDELV